MVKLHKEVLFALNENFKASTALEVYEGMDYNGTPVAVLEYNREATMKSIKLDNLVEVIKNDHSFRPEPVPEGQDETTFLVEQFLDTLEELDPTPNKKYVPLMFKLYAKGGHRATVEDLPLTFLASVKILEEAKRLNLLDNPDDINLLKYKSLNELELTARSYQDAVNKKKGVKEAEKAGGKWKLLGETPTAKVILIEDYIAAAYWGTETTWCTAATDGGKRYYEGYCSDGSPLVVIIPKQPETVHVHSRANKTHAWKEKYQLHIVNRKDSDGETQRISQFKDINDNEVDYAAVLAKFPGVGDIILKTVGPGLGSVIKSNLEANSEEDIANLVMSLEDCFVGNIEKLLTKSLIDRLILIDGQPIDISLAVEAALAAVENKDCTAEITSELVRLKKAGGSTETVRKTVPQVYFVTILKYMYKYLRDNFGKDSVSLKQTNSGPAAFIDYWKGQIARLVVPKWDSKNTTFVFEVKK